MGMNFYDPKVGTPFLFSDHIVDILDCFKTRYVQISFCLFNCLSVKSSELGFLLALRVACIFYFI